MTGENVASVAELWGANVQVDPALHLIVINGPIHSNFDDRLRASFILLESRIREKANLPQTEYGVGLVQKAFGEHGPLQSLSVVKGERDGFVKLFEGVFQLYRSPVAHRPLYHGKEAAWSLFYLINHLLRLVEEAAEAGFDINRYFGAQEGQILRRRDYRLDIDDDGEAEIVSLIEAGPTSEGGALSGHLAVD